MNVSKNNIRILKGLEKGLFLLFSCPLILAMAMKEVDRTPSYVLDENSWVIK